MANPKNFQRRGSVISSDLRDVFTKAVDFASVEERDVAIKKLMDDPTKPPFAILLPTRLAVSDGAFDILENVLPPGEYPANLTDMTSDAKGNVTLRFQVLGPDGAEHVFSHRLQYDPTYDLRP